MRRLFSFFLVFVCMFISFRGVIANNMGDDFGEESFFKVEEEVASVSSKYAQKVSETPAILSVFTREQLQDMGCRTLADALRFVPGIGVSIDELGGYNKVAIRGVRQWPNVLFLVDGQRLNDFYTGLALYDFPIDNIEKVEIIRGPGSSIHGTGGFVGVISIITNQNIPEGFTAKSEAGKDKTLRTSINWSGKIEGWKTNLFAEIYQTDGQKHQLYGSPTQINLLQGRTQPHLPISSINMTGDDVNVPLENQKRNNMQSYNDYFVNGYELALVDIGKTKEDKQKITLDYKMMKDNTNLRFKYIYDSRGPNIGMFGWKLPNTNLARGIYTAYLDRSNKLSDNCDIITKFYFDRQMVDNRLQTSADTPLIGEVSESNRGDYQILKYAAQTFGTEIQVNYRISKHNFVSGLQFERLGLEDYSLEKENSAGIMQEIQQENKSRTVLGLFI